MNQPVKDLTTKLAPYVARPLVQKLQGKDKEVEDKIKDGYATKERKGWSIQEL